LLWSNCNFPVFNHRKDYRHKPPVPSLWQLLKNISYSYLIRKNNIYVCFYIWELKDFTHWNM
jgi:hypothetical protein